MVSMHRVNHIDLMTLSKQSMEFYQSIELHRHWFIIESATMPHRKPLAVWQLNEKKMYDTGNHWTMCIAFLFQ